MNATYDRNSTAYRIAGDTAGREARPPAAPVPRKPTSFTLATATAIVTFTPVANGVRVRSSIRDHARRNYGLTAVTMATDAARAEYRRLVLAVYRPW